MSKTGLIKLNERLTPGITRRALDYDSSKFPMTSKLFRGRVHDDVRRGVAVPLPGNLRSFDYHISDLASQIIALFLSQQLDVRH